MTAGGGLKKKVCIVVSSEMTVKTFLKCHILALVKYYEVTLIVNTTSLDFAELNELPIKVIPVAIERSIKPIADMRALYELISIFKKQRFDIVHSVTPKAGLLAMLAGKVARVPFRIHMFTGQVWANKVSIARFLLRWVDYILAGAATHLLADSFSQKAFLLEEGITCSRKIGVLADGSICGVDTNKFKPNNLARLGIREKLNIHNNDIILIFMGRLSRDKGILDLAAAFTNIAGDLSNLHLLVVGEDEGGLQGEIECIVREDYVSRLHFIEHTDQPEKYLAAADILCLPSYREGFGNVIIEAAACGVPAIGSNIYGLSDAVSDGETGMLFEVGNKTELTAMIRGLADDSKQREKLSQAALDRVRNVFPTKRLVDAWLNYYNRLL